jgi:hypothetical protein
MSPIQQVDGLLVFTKHVSSNGTALRVLGT